MSASKRNSKDSWDPDTAPEIPDDAWDRAQIAVGGKIIREAEGTLTKRGRPPVGDATKQQVTLRLAPKVVEHFKASGAGWQTRLSSVLERHVAGTLREHRSSFSHGSTGGDQAMAKDEKTGKKAGTAASKVLKSDSTGKDSKTAAGSALTQRPTRKK